MIARVWKGYAKLEKASDYLEHLEKNVLPELHTIDGFRGVSVLQRQTPEGIEFMVMTRWDSMEAIHQFAGADAEVAVVEPAARAALYAFDTTVTHFEIVMQENSND